MDQLRDAYRNNRLILFVGSGVSANIGLPPWKELIDEIAVQLDYDPEVFNTYGNFLALAEYYRIKKGSIGPLRSWMDREWHRNIEIRDSEIHRLIVHGRFPAIYTTNYDRWLNMPMTPTRWTTSRSPMPATSPRRVMASGRSSSSMAISMTMPRSCSTRPAITNGCNSKRH